MIDLYNTNYMSDNKKEDNLNKLLDNCIDEEFIEIKLHLLKILGKNIFALTFCSYFFWAIFAITSYLFLKNIHYS